MAQGVLPFQYESAPGSSDLTGFAGFGVYLDLMKASGLVAAVRRHARRLIIRLGSEVGLDLVLSARRKILGLARGPT